MAALSNKEMANVLILNFIRAEGEMDGSPKFRLEIVQATVSLRGPFRAIAPVRASYRSARKPRNMNCFGLDKSWIWP
jgi:hypothetical protein